MENENILLNPIDIIEDVIHQKKWNFSRAADHELVAEIASHWCAYRLYFTWSENINALSFSITFDIKFPETKNKLKRHQRAITFSRYDSMCWASSRVHFLMFNKKLNHQAIVFSQLQE